MGIKKRVTNLKLSDKIILVNVFILALPILIGFFIIFNDMREKFIDETILNAKNDIGMIALNMTNDVENMIGIEELITNDYELKEFLSREEVLSPEDFIYFSKSELETLSKIQSTNPDINDLRMFYNNDNLYEIWPHFYEINRLELDNYQKILKVRVTELWDLNKSSKKFSWHPVDDEEPVVSFYSSIFYPTNNFIGIFEINMKSEVFYKNLLIQERNNINYYIYHNNEILKEKINIEEDKHFDLRTLIDLNQTSVNSEYGRFEIIKEHVSSIDVDIYALVDIDAINKTLKNETNRLIYLTLALLLILSLVMNQLIKLLLKKLGIIIDRMREVQNGNLEVDIPIYGHDEMGELAYHFRKMLKRINELIENVLKKQSAVKDAEIRALQTQINSHFIYNVLENIKMKAEINYEHDISDSITHLGSLMRYSMEWNNHIVKLKDELEYVSRYIELFNMRMDYQIRLELAVEPEILEMDILKMTIQPIVENAIEHGITPKVDVGIIRISSVVIDSKKYIEITDDGVGMSEEKLNEIREYLKYERYDENDSGTSIGLLNVKNRLELFYHYDEDDFIIDSKENQFTKIRIRLKTLI